MASERKVDISDGQRELLLEFDAIMDDLAFTGFNPRLLRMKLMTEGLSTGSLTILLACYIQLGNKTSKVGKRRVQDATKIAQLQAIFTKHQVVESGTRRGADQCTLSQIAISYAPILYAMRTHAEQSGKLQNQFPHTELPAALQDPALGPLAVFMGLEAQYRRFSYAFYKALAGTRGKAVPREIDWLQIACSGFTQDLASGVVVSAMMDPTKRPSTADMIDLYHSHDDGLSGESLTIMTSSTVTDVMMQTALEAESKMATEGADKILAFLNPGSRVIASDTEETTLVHPVSRTVAASPAAAPAPPRVVARPKGIVRRVFGF